jgi:hypothetical protein
VNSRQSDTWNAAKAKLLCAADAIARCADGFTEDNFVCLTMGYAVAQANMAINYLSQFAAILNNEMNGESEGRPDHPERNGQK